MRHATYGQTRQRNAVTNRGDAAGNGDINAGAAVGYPDARANGSADGYAYGGAECNSRTHAGASTHD